MPGFLQVFGLTVAACLTDPVRLHGPRDLDVVEIFAGVASIAGAAKEAGYRAMAFDKSRVPGLTDSLSSEVSEDVSCEHGFLHAVSLVMRLRVGGLLWIAPVCSSWVWLNVSMTKRSADNCYKGDTKYKPVQEGNHIAILCAFLLELAFARKLQAVLENPPVSYIWKFPPLASCLERLGMNLHTAICHRCAYEESLSSESKLRLGKRYKLVATGAWIQGARRSCKCPGRKHQVLTKRWIKYGKRKCAGKRELLTQSAAYPRGLGKVIIQVWQQGTTTVLSPTVPGCTPNWLKPNVEAPQSRVHSPKISAQGSSWLKPALLVDARPIRERLEPMPRPTKRANSEGCDQSWMKPAA